MRTDRLLKEAMLAFSKGRFDDCETLARTVLAIAPRNPGANHLLGVSFGQRGQLNEAIEPLQAAAALAPKNAEIQRNLGLTFDRLGRKPDAIASYRRAAELKPDDAQAHGNLARLLHEQGDLAEAIASLRRALEIVPGNASAQHKLGQFLQEQGKLPEAAARFRRAIAIEPGNFQAQRDLGMALHKLGNLPAAVAHCRRAVDLKPDDARAWTVLGGVLRDQGRFEEAKAAYRRALEIRPGYASAHVDLGIALRNEGDLQGAIAQYDHALAIAPQLDDAKLYKSFALLLSGRLGDGWDLYEFRHSPRSKNKARVVLPQMTRPLWEGQDLAGKTLLLVREQGLGDQIQFLRYVPLLAERGATVDVVVAASLVALAESVPGVRHAFTTLAGRDCDYWLPLLSLPLRLGTEVATIPAKVPYLRAPERSIRDWAARIGAVARGRYRVGLVWAGGKGHEKNHHRSLGIEQLMPLVTVKNTCFVSLQKDEPARELWKLHARSDIVDLADELRSFSDTAGAMMNLDLVISVDTSVAHLAGALGRPVWTLLPYAPDWRWMLERDDSPWYPTMRLYRQPMYGDWESVVAKVTRDVGCKATVPHGAAAAARPRG